jgi:hypothetical protein
MMVHRCQSAHPSECEQGVSNCGGYRLGHNIARGIFTILFAPTTEVLVQVKFGGAIAELDVGQPFSDNVQ